MAGRRHRSGFQRFNSLLTEADHERDASFCKVPWLVHVCTHYVHNHSGSSILPPRCNIPAVPLFPGGQLKPHLSFRVSGTTMSSQPAVELTYGSKDMFFPSSGMQLLSALLQFLGKLSPPRLSPFPEFYRCFYSGPLPFT